MFNKKQRGLACLEPLIGRKEPSQQHFPDLYDPHCGDLQDIRNRLGLLSPPAPRYVELELNLHPQNDPQRTKAIMEYMQNAYKMSVWKHKPYYVDPYGRNLPGGAADLKMRYRPVSGLASMHPLISGDTLKKPATQRDHKLAAATGQAKQKREEQRQRDAKTWGQGSDKDLSSLSSQSAGKKGQAVSLHLYQPKTVHTKSEWTKNMEVAMALTRKKDVQDKTVRRLECHQQHGDHVRIARDQKESQTLEKHVNTIRNKDEQFAKFLKDKVQYM